MQKNYTLIASFKNSFYSPEFYKEIPKFTFGKVMGYFLMLMLMTYLVFLGEGAYELWNNRGFVEEKIAQVEDSYPSDLILTFENGKLTTNGTEPIYFPTEPITSHRDEDPAYLVVIDTKTPFSATQFSAYKSIVWLGEDSAYVQNQDKGGEIKAVPYPEDFSQVITKDTLKDVAGQLWVKMKPFIVAASIFLLLFFFVALSVFYFAYLAIAALFYFLGSQVAGLKREYTDCYRMSVYGLTPVLLLNLALQVLSLFWTVTMPPFLFTAVLLGTIFLSVRQQKPRKA